MKKSQIFKKLNWQDNDQEIRKEFCKNVWLGLPIPLSATSLVFVFLNVYVYFSEKQIMPQKVLLILLSF